MPKYYRAIEIVEAVQWFPPGDPRHQPLDYVRPSSEVPGSIPGEWYIRTASGWANVWPEQWIVHVAKGDALQLSPDEFGRQFHRLADDDDIGRVTLLEYAVGSVLSLSRFFRFGRPGAEHDPSLPCGHAITVIKAQDAKIAEQDKTIADLKNQLASANQQIARLQKY